MSLIVHHLCAWWILPDNSALLVNLRYHFFGYVDQTGLLHRLVTWK